MPPCSARRSAGFYCLFHMVGCFRHQVQHSVTGPHHAIALELGAWVNACYKGLGVRLLRVAELDVEEAQLVAFGPRLPALEEVAGFGGRTRHERDTPRVNDWYSQRDCPSSRSEPG